MTELAEVRIDGVLHALGGPQIRHGRIPAWWRESQDLNVSIDIHRGVFYDHVQNRGGGVLALVETVLSCDRGSALAFLVAQGFIESRRFTWEQRREHLRRREEAGNTAEVIECWRGAYVSELNMRKVAAIGSGDDAALTDAASLCHVLENGSAQDVIQEFIRHKTANPSAMARFISLGQERHHEDRRIAAAVTLLLAQVAELEALQNAH